MADCVDIVRNGVAKGMSDDEIIALYERVKKARQKIERAGRRADDLETELVEAVQAEGDQATIEAIAQKRAMAIQTAKRAQAIQYILTNFQGREADGLSSLLVGTNYARENSRMSVDAQANSLTGYYVGGLLSELENLNGPHLALFKKGTLDEQVSKALFSLDNKEAPAFDGPSEALDIAKVAAKAVFVKLFVSFAVPEPARIG